MIAKLFLKSRKWTSISLVMMLIVQIMAAWITSVAAFAVTSSISMASFTEQPGGKAAWTIPGDFNSWDKTAGFKLKHLANGDFYGYSANLTAGTYGFKFVLNDDWNQSIGDGANNFSLTLANDGIVNFYIKGNSTGDAQIRVEGATVAGITSYSPTRDSSNWPRLVGSTAGLLGVTADGGWSPSTSDLYFIDYNFDNTVYMLQRDLSVGSSDAKVVFGSSWSDPNYGVGSGNLTVDVTDAAVPVVLKIDASAQTPELSQVTSPTQNVVGVDMTSFPVQPGGIATWTIPGDFNSWDKTDGFKLKHLSNGDFYGYSADLKAGTYGFKFVLNDDWNQSIGNGSNNFSLTLANDGIVNFYIKGNTTGNAVIRVEGTTVAGITSYTQARNLSNWPRLVGGTAGLLGVTADGGWSPSTSDLYFVDYNFDGSVYYLQRNLPVGSSDAKVVFGSSWSDPNYGVGSGNLSVNVTDATEPVVLKIDAFAETKQLSQRTVGQIDPVADVIAEQPGGLVKWTIPGDFNSWNESTGFKMKHIANGDYYEYSTVLDPGTYSFAFVMNGSWDNKVSNNGLNYSMTVSKQSKVNFYVRGTKPDNTVVRVTGATVPAIPVYVPSRDESNLPRLVGSIAKPLGVTANDGWSPSTSELYFVDYNFDGSVYLLQRDVPKGNYDAKVTLGTNWDENYGGNGPGDPNLSLNLIDPSNRLLFTFDASQPEGQRKLEAKLLTDGFDGVVSAGSVYYDSRNELFKTPFGALKQAQQDLTLRIQADEKDVQRARVELMHPDQSTTTYDMHFAFRKANKDYFEVTIPKAEFDQYGIWGYKFVLTDGQSKVEYGEDNKRGGSGNATADDALTYDLTVYKSDFQPPTWLQSARIYQIFPDRFFDGDKSNNRAKVVDGSRGYRNEGDMNNYRKSQKIEYFDGGVANDPVPDQVWGTTADYPENPQRSYPENKAYFPDAKSDGEWSNEFYGGDLQGITQKLNYIKSLGFNTIYLNPVEWSESNHKYNATDYNHVDPMFAQPVYNTPGEPKSGLNYAATRIASDKVFTDLAKAADEVGIRLIADGVFNHIGDDSIYFDRYEKYPEIGAYEYWAKVFDRMKSASLTQTASEQAIKNEFKNKVNPTTGQKYIDEDFKYTSMFTITNDYRFWDQKKLFSSYNFNGWYGNDSLPEFDSKSQDQNELEDIPGMNEWNNKVYRDLVIGYDLNGKTDQQKLSAVQNTASQRWLWMGANAWRLDAARDVSSGTWKQFRKAVKSVAGLDNVNGKTIEEPALIAEDWGNASDLLLGDQFDTVMNYRFIGAIEPFLTGINDATAADTAESLESIREDYPPYVWKSLLNLLDSHDTTRFITRMDDYKLNQESLKVAPEPKNDAYQRAALGIIMQYAYPGAPMVYYGDEVGLPGTKDPDSRRFFPWSKIQGSNNSYSATGAGSELFTLYKKLGQARSDHSVFADGDVKILYAEGDVIVIGRRNATESAIVALNRADTSKKVTLNLKGYIANGITFSDALDNVSDVSATNGSIELTIPAVKGVVLISNAQLNVPQIPQNVVENVGQNGVDLTWDVVSSTSYDVYRSEWPGEIGSKIGTIAAGDNGAYTDSVVSKGQHYYYQIVARKDSGETSAPSSQLDVYVPWTVSSVSAPDITGATVDLDNGTQTGAIKVTIDVPGVTNDSNLADLKANVILGDLEILLNGEIIQRSPLKYLEDSSGKKVYYATFQPLSADTFDVRARVSTDFGNHYTTSSSTQITIAKTSSDTTAPDAVTLSAINEQSNQAHLNWSAATQDVKLLVIQRKKQSEQSYENIAFLQSDAIQYADVNVHNGVTYEYRVVAYDQAMNVANSNTVSVTPQMAIIDVTLHLHMNDDLGDTDNVNVSGTFNNWSTTSSILQVPSGATTRETLEYKFKMFSGKQIQYKYNRGDWNTEALTSNVAEDINSHKNFAFSTTGDNMQVTIMDQGDHKMLVDDYVLRWVDLPVIVYLPKKQAVSRFKDTTQEVTYETTSDTTDLKLKVPFGVDVKVNNQLVGSSEHDGVGNLWIKNISTAVKTTTLNVAVAPSAETLALSWFPKVGEDFTKNVAKSTQNFKVTITNPNYTATKLESFKLSNSIIDNNDAGINVSWNSVADQSITEYRIYVDGVAVAKVPANKTSYEITGLLPDTVYKVTMGTGNGSGKFLLSDSKNFRTAELPVAIPVPTSVPTLVPTQVPVSTPTPMVTATPVPTASPTTAASATPIPIVVVPTPTIVVPITTPTVISGSTPSSTQPTVIFNPIILTPVKITNATATATIPEFDKTGSYKQTLKIEANSIQATFLVGNIDKRLKVSFVVPKNQRRAIESFNYTIFKNSTLKVWVKLKQSYKYPIAIDLVFGIVEK